MNKLKALMLCLINSNLFSDDDNVAPGAMFKKWSEMWASETEDIKETYRKKAKDMRDVPDNQLTLHQKKELSAKILTNINSQVYS